MIKALFCLLSLLILAAGPSSKPKIELSPRVQFGVTGQAVRLSALLTGKFPRYVIVELSTDSVAVGESPILGHSLIDLEVQRYIPLQVTLSEQDFYIRRERASRDDLFTMRAEEVDISESDHADVTLTLIARSPSQAEADSVHLTKEDLAESFGTEKYEKIWARQSARVKLSCPMCIH